MKIKYRDIHLSKANLVRLDEINRIIVSYQRQGYRLTLRQLYYQLVSRDVIPNNTKEYGKLSGLLKEGRMAGVVDWEAIEDRLRKPDRPAHWDSPEQIIQACIDQYRCDRMEGQSTYLEVWVEKDALSGVLKRVTEKYGINIVVNRGYSSATAMHDAHERFETEIRKIGASEIKVIYVGDFDPSGQDMIRDVRDRIAEFNGSYDFEIMPIALTWDQIQEHDPPTNPAKITDPRAKAYIEKYGEYSWEVDALPPEVLDRLLDDAIQGKIDDFQYRAVLEVEKAHIETLKKAITFVQTDDNENEEEE
jgi:hypothetical protein